MDIKTRLNSLKLVRDPTPFVGYEITDGLCTLNLQNDFNHLMITIGRNLIRKRKHEG